MARARGRPGKNLARPASRILAERQRGLFAGHDPAGQTLIEVRPRPALPEWVGGLVVTEGDRTRAAP